MALISLDPEEIFEYTPKFDRKNTKDPLIVKVKYMPNSEHIQFVADIGKDMRTTNDPEKQTEIGKAHDRRKFIEHVVGFENWFKNDGTPEPDDISRFYDVNDADLIFEINTAYASTSILTAFQKKT